MLKNLIPLSVLAFGLTTQVATAKPIVIKLPTVSTTVLHTDKSGNAYGRNFYMPVPLPISTTKPAGIKELPAFSGKAYYGEFKLGNGDQSETTFALDMGGNVPTLYVDKDHNGDLAAYHYNSWKPYLRNGVPVDYGTLKVTLNASYKINGTPETTPYKLALYVFTGPTPRLMMYTQTARTGTFEMNGNTEGALLVEDACTGIYKLPMQKLDSSGHPVSSVQVPPVELWVGNPAKPSTYQEVGTLSTPFKFDGKEYVGTASVDGSKVVLTPSNLPLLAGPPPPKPLLAAGVMAPNFTAILPDGKSIQLADLKGKTVILDFWATWCGPCQESMPHLEHIYNALKSSGKVAVLGVCVFDNKPAFDAWVVAKKGVFTFPVAYDPAGRGPNSIAGKLYNVQGIPTTYLIAPDGKVITSLVGYGGASDNRLELALAKAGVPVPATTASAYKH